MKTNFNKFSNSTKKKKRVVKDYPFETMQQIMKGEYQLLNRDWKNYSPECKDLLQHLLCMDPIKRYSAKEALAHPWFNSEIEKKD